MKKKLFILSFLLLIIPIQFLFLYVAKNPWDDNQGNVAGIESNLPAGILNWAGIGEFRFTLYGYTSPFAVVTFDGQGVFDQTVADKTGYFEFKNRFSPFSPREACLSSKDQFGRLTSPVCLPPFPIKYNVSIGPILIPPTVSLNKDIYYIDDEVILSGQTIPNTQVDLSIFGGTNSRLSSMIYNLGSIIKPVEAFTFPELTARSDKAGNFSLVLPSSNPQDFRLFTQVNYKDSVSPSSVKLNFQVYPVWMIIIRFFLMIIAAIKSRLLEIVIAAEIIYILSIFYSFFFGSHKSRAIILAENLLPETEEEKLPVIEDGEKSLLVEA